MQIVKDQEEKKTVQQATEIVQLTKAQTREYKKIQLKLKGYINAFYAICYFDKKTLDWNSFSQDEFNKLKKKWTAWCKSRGYSNDFGAAFHWDCMLLKVDLIMQTKFKAEGDKAEILTLLKKGMTPLEVAKYVYKNLETKKI